MELANVSNLPVNLEQWSLRDPAGGARLTRHTVPPGGFIVVTGDTAAAGWLPHVNDLLTADGFPALNNSGDTLFIYDQEEQLIDQVTYTDQYSSNLGRSLERVSPAGPSGVTVWVPSPAEPGHTAGGPNAASLPDADTGIELSPNPLRINRARAALSIRYTTPYPAIIVRATIYDLAGRKLGTIYNHGPVSGAGELTWDAGSLDDNRYRTGQYVLLFEATDTVTGRRWRKAERLILVN
ncbi:MAG: lamin tail domain-containing protein [Candidatus Marinimicrobia bacterium]|nr:lamin tail domain-containing protein [Candidatus Neomarinimicrobiota bacterium]